KVGIQLAHFLSQHVRRRRRGTDACHDAEPERRELAERQVDEGVHVRTKSRLTNGWTNAHHRAPGTLPEPNLVSNGILAGPVLRGKSLIHDDGFGSRGAV